MSRTSIVAGVGMIPFMKPGRSDDNDEMGSKAARAELADAGISHDLIGQGYFRHVYGDSPWGHAAAEKRKVQGATPALQHNFGIGGACVVTPYEKVI